MKLEFYEPPMCCPTGVCGPSPDEKLIRIQQDIDYLKQKYTDIEIQRYMVNTHPAKFKENSGVLQLVKENGIKSLPITTYNGEVIMKGGYPSLEIIERRIGDELNGH